MLTAFQPSKDVPYKSCPSFRHKEYPWYAFGEDQRVVACHTRRGEEKSKVRDGIPGMSIDLLHIPCLTGYR